MKQLVVIACLVVAMVAAVRKEVNSINIFFNKISILLAKTTIVIKSFCQNLHDHHLDQHLPL